MVGCGDLLLTLLFDVVGVLFGWKAFWHEMCRHGCSTYTSRFAILPGISITLRLWYYRNACLQRIFVLSTETTTSHHLSA